MRTPLIAGNWKMHHGVGATQTFLEDLLRQPLPDTVEVLLCPPFTSLPVAAMVVAGSEVRLGAQNVHGEASGAFTGEVSPQMLNEIGISHVIIGHSERRTLFGETDKSAAARAAGAQRHGLSVVYCLGETLEQRQAGQTEQVVRQQASFLAELDPAALVVAYEPVWAIGTGHTATPEQAQEAHAVLRQELANAFGDEAAEQLRILYGGSMKPANALDLLVQPDVDGGLIGGASLDVASFSAIIRAAAERPS